MAIERPKILTRVTIPTGGWGLQFTISIGGSLNTALTATVAAGDYFVAWDEQSDDLLYAVTSAIRSAISGAGHGAQRFPGAWIDADNKVNIDFQGTNFTGAIKQDVAINWTHANTEASLAAALGFDNSADDTSTGVDNPSFTADYQHSYAWYANEDGLLEFKPIEDNSAHMSSQVKSLSGRVSTQYLAENFNSSLRLNFVQRTRMFSNGTAYSTAPVEPYARNVPLECWWEEARKGTEFRVYREGRNSSTTDAVIEHVAQGTTTSVGTSSVTDSGLSMQTDPQKYKGMLLRCSWLTSQTRFYISSHTATVFTAPNNASSGTNIASSSRTLKVLPQIYETYVVDLGAMGQFEPNEIPNIDRFGLDIPLLRYV